MENQDQQEITNSLAEREQKLAYTEQENIRRLREKTEQREREYQQQLNAMKQELEAAKKAAQVNINDDDVAEGKHIKELANQLRQMQEAQQKERQTQMAMMAEMRIKSEMPQIEQIVNEKNLSILKERYPHLHNSIFNSQDMYERAKIAHTLITEMRIIESAQNGDRADANLRKPQSGAQGALQNKYLYDQFDLTPEEARTTHEMARRYARGQR